MRYKYTNDGRDFEVQYDSYPPDTSLRFNGIQAEPDYAGYVEINSVTLLGVEMIDLLSEWVLEEIQKDIMGVTA